MNILLLCSSVTLQWISIDILSMWLKYNEWIKKFLHWLYFWWAFVCKQIEYLSWEVTCIWTGLAMINPLKWNICLFVGSRIFQEQAKYFLGMDLPKQSYVMPYWDRVADLTCYFLLSLYTDTRPTSSCTDPVDPGTQQVSHHVPLSCQLCHSAGEGGEWSPHLPLSRIGCATRPPRGVKELNGDTNIKCLVQVMAQQ